MIKLSWVEEWINRKDSVFVNAPAALQAMGARGFYEAVRSCMPKYKRLKERDKAKRPSSVDDDMGYFICPNCGGAIYYSDEKESHEFCLMCGQRIDWSEQENGGNE